MKKYILKKDLPFAKAGDEVLIKKEGLPSIMTNSGYLCDLPSFEFDNWIEEVKPRTFYINKTKNGGLYVYCKEEQASLGATLDSTETIKVVECI